MNRLVKLLIVANLGFASVGCAIMGSNAAATRDDPVASDSASQSQAIETGKTNTGVDASSRDAVDPVAVNAPTLDTDDYHIGANDLLEISVFQIPELSRTVRVNARGLISLPLIGIVKASGLTGQQLEQEIGKKLSDGFLQDPQVSIFIKEYTSQKVTIEGSVEKAGVYPLTGRTTLLQAIAQAAGPNDVANYNAIKLIRARSDGTKDMTLHDLEAIRDGKAVDPVLVGNDIIVVDKSTSRATIKDITDTLRGFFSFGTLR